MIDWRENVIKSLSAAVQDDLFWSVYLSSLSNGQNPSFSIHLGVFIEPFLQYILDGRKTMETRFSVVRCAPFERVDEGDVVLLKKSGGAIVGLCQIRSARFYKLEKDSWDEIKTFARDICAEDLEFWEHRKKASFASLMRIHNVKTIPPIIVNKRDRRGWVILQEASKDLLFEK